MTDLATFRTAHEAGFTSRVRREVVVVHVTLGLVYVDRVEHLLHFEHAERRGVQHLSLAASEQRRSMSLVQ